MKWIRLATIAFLFGGVANCALYSQLPGYGPPPGSPSNYGYNQDYGAPPIPRNDVGFFYDELSPYGDWVQTRDYGWAWFPRNVPPYWRPYTDGRWVDSEYGWTWVSNEPFGWATYHYGRWALDPRFGWLWVPGTVWGPAWVSWQQGDGYIGWAPLPPQVGFEIGMGIRLGGFNLSTGISSNAYNFVPERSFLDTRLSRYMVPTARNVTIIYNTTNITHYSYSNNRVVNRGVDVRRIEQMTGRRIQPFRVTQARAPARSSVTGNEVRIYRPDEQRLKSVRAAQSLKAAPRNLPPPMRQGRNLPKRLNGPSPRGSRRHRVLTPSRSSNKTAASDNNSINTWRLKSSSSRRFTRMSSAGREPRPTALGSKVAIESRPRRSRRRDKGPCNSFKRARWSSVKPCWRASRRGP